MVNQKITLNPTALTKKAPSEQADAPAMPAEVIENQRWYPILVRVHLCIFLSACG
jgi:hypothetical protein